VIVEIEGNGSSRFTSTKPWPRRCGPRPTSGIVNPHRSSLLSELESVGFEVRVIGSHVAVLNSDGDEVAALPLTILDRGARSGDLLNRQAGESFEGSSCPARLH
jgi:hypothetical protein